jgi:hypothetical protein
MKITVLYDVLPPSSELKTLTSTSAYDAKRSSETSVSIYQTIPYHIPEDHNLHIYRRDNMKSHKWNICSKQEVLCWLTILPWIIWKTHTNLGTVSCCWGEKFRNKIRGTEFVPKFVVPAAVNINTLVFCDMMPWSPVNGDNDFRVKSIPTLPLITPTWRPFLF